MKQLYYLNEAEQAELLEATEGMRVVLNREGKAGTVGDKAKVKRLWKRWAKEKDFKIKSIAPHESEEAAFWATPKTLKEKP